MNPTNTSYSRKVRSDRSPLWKNGRPPLTWLDIELTERCNNDCVHCSINLPAGDKRALELEMTAGFVMSVLEQAAALGCLGVRFTGGEPFWRDDFVDIYLFARHLGMKVMIFTNATLITPRLAGVLSRTPPLEKMEVSIYGMRAGSYEAVTRTPGSFEAARKGLSLLVEHRIPFVLKSAYLPANKHERDEFETWAAGLPGGDRKPSYAMFLDLRSRRDPEKNELIRSLRIPPREGAGLLTAMARDGGEERRRFVAEFGGPQGDRLFTCLAGGGRGAIDAYGHFQYCLTLRHPDTIYDLNRGSLRDAVLDLPPRLRALKALNPEYLHRCGRCFLKALCLQCPAKSWAEHGTLDTPVDYFCEVAHAQAEALGLLGEGEPAWTVGDWESRIERLTGVRPGRGREDGPCPEKEKGDPR